MRSSKQYPATTHMNNKHTQLSAFLHGKSPGVFLHTARSSETQKPCESYLFLQPRSRIVCFKRAGISKALAAVEKLIASGKYVAGYCSYELGYGLDDAFKKVPISSTYPLLWFGVFDKPITYTNLDLAEIVSDTGEFWGYHCRHALSKNAYGRGIDAIQKYLQAGDTYQINYCSKLMFDYRGNGAALFAALNQQQKVAYAAYIHDGKRHICSVSPELFFSIKGNSIVMKPMKGTLLKKRGRAHIQQSVRAFKACDKNKAENLMIVDLIRNDCGKICVPHSIAVPKLFTIEEYETLYQMTSTISGTLKRSRHFGDVLKALFPSGSVTGAPKIRSMEIIRELEQAPRGIYTGAVGFCGPKMKKAVFNIPIRTVVLDSNKMTGEMGIGSGVVFDSKARNEYDECVGKARFLHAALKQYEIIETLRYDPGKGFALITAHIHRLAASAAYFNIPCNRSALKRMLKERAAGFRPQKAYRVRILMNDAGDCKLSHAIISDTVRTQRTIAVSKHAVDSRNVFLRHKTTNRRLYDAEHRKARKRGLSDVIFMNEKHQVTEGAISNVFVKKNGIYCTPPVSCGLLPGTYRDALLKRKKGIYREKVLWYTDLVHADEIYLCNSVQGMMRVTLKGRM